MFGNKLHGVRKVWSLIGIIIFERNVGGCDFENIYRKDTCSKEIRLHAQNAINILGSIVNILRRTCH
jgi:hypothetical protein